MELQMAIGVRQMVYRPPWQKISRTPMAISSSILLLKFFVYSK